MVDPLPKANGSEASSVSRRADRVALVIPIQVSGANTQGKTFNEKTQTLELNRFGALIMLTHSLAIGQQITVRCSGTGKETQALVIDQVESRNEKEFLYGVELLSPGANIWELHFPSATESEMAAGRMLMECSRCKNSELVYLTLTEIEAFQKNKQVSRICKPCNTVTAWHQATLDQLQIEQAAVAVDPMSGEVDAPTVEHSEDDRTEPRVDLRSEGCIQTAENGEDFVQTENISESGACFKSRKKYPGGASVGVAIPFTHGAANVFVQARITWAHSTPVEGVTAYGLAYFHAGRRASRIRPRTKTTIGFIGGGFRSTGTIVDISMKGALVQCSEQFKPGDVVKMGIEMSQEIMPLTGVARRVIPGIGTGFEFTSMGRNDRALLRRLILKVEKQS